MSVPDAAEPRPKSRKLYIVLAAAVGTLGIHNFYVGRRRAGAAQLVLGGFSLGAGWRGISGFLNRLPSDPPDLSDPMAAQALVSSALADTGWVAMAATAAFVIVGVWVAAEIFTVKRDGAGNRLG